MFKDDIGALPSSIPSSYDPQTVLAQQIKLVLRHMPLALLGTVFTALCFFSTMYITYDLNANQKALNIFWLIYQCIILVALQMVTRLIMRRANRLSLPFLRKIFTFFTVLFLLAIGIGVPMFISMLYRVPLMELTAAKALIMLWILFHVALLAFCWRNWRKVEGLFYSLNESSRQQHGSALAIQIPVKHTLYLAHYTVYNILFICALAIACLWALAIGKAFTTNLQNVTQVIVLLGLHLGLLSGGISSLATFWRIYIAYTVPSVLVWIFLLVYMGDSGLAILSFAVLGLLFFNIFFAKHTSLNTLKAILVYLENENLVAQLQIKTRQVEEASLAKTQFLAAASHDLRQPVHALSLFIETLSDTDLDCHQKQIVDYAKSASQSSREMLNTILDYAHLESGQMIPHFVPTKLDNIIRHLIDEFGIQAHSKGLTLRYKPTDIWVMTDPTMVALILRNFISNAIRYTRQGGVLVGVRELPSSGPILIEYCRISVWDTGVGMTPSEIEQVFDSFYQIERNNVNNQGLGLGLAIVKGLARILNADLEVKSNLGRGSQFSITLPTCDEAISAVTCGNTVKDYLPGKTVLIVDDETTVLKSMHLLLQSWGCQTITAQTVTDAVAAFRSHQPDIVVTDFRLAHGESGEHVIMAINESSEPLTAPPFVILTANTSPQLFKTTKAINPTILHKPIDPKHLHHCLQQIAANQRQI